MNNIDELLLIFNSYINEIAEDKTSLQNFIFYGDDDGYSYSDYSSYSDYGD